MQSNPLGVLRVLAFRAAAQASALGAAVFGVGIGHAAAQPVLTQIALTGETTPGAADGAAFDRVNAGRGPVINDAGDVGFAAILQTGSGPGAGVVGTGNDLALLGPTSGAGSALGVLAREGDAAPGASDMAAFDVFLGLRLNNAGSVVFPGNLRTGSAAGAGVVNALNDSVLLGRLGGGSSTTILARQGEPAPGFGSGVVLGDLGDGFFGERSTLNDNDVVLFLSEVNQLVTTLYAIVPDNGSTSTVPVAAEGASAPGAGGALFVEINDRGPVLNNTNDFAFQASVTGPGNGPVDAVIGPVNGPGSTEQTLVIGFTGDELPPGGAAFDTFSLPVLNDAGELAVRGTLQTTTGPQGAIIGQTAGPGSAFGVLFSEGQVLPGVADSAAVTGFGDPVLNDAGDLAFLSRLDAVTSDGNTLIGVEAIFGPTGGAGSGIGLIARTGQEAPGTGGARFRSFIPGEGPALNDEGDLVFEATLLPGEDPGAAAIDSTNNEGLFTYVDGELTLLVRRGQSIEVTTPGSTTTELRTIQDINFNTDRFGPTNGLSDTGLLAFALTFTDGAEGIFTTDLTPVATLLEGDFNDDRVVNTADFVAFRDNAGAPAGALPNDPNGGPIGVAQHQTFITNFGRRLQPAASVEAAAVPEPNSQLILLVASCGCLIGRNR